MPGRRVRNGLAELPVPASSFMTRERRIFVLECPAIAQRFALAAFDE